MHSGNKSLAAPATSALEKVTCFSSLLSCVVSERSSPIFRVWFRMKRRFHEAEVAASSVAPRGNDKMKKAEDFDFTVSIYKSAAQHVFNDLASGVYEIRGENTSPPIVKSADSIAAFINMKMDAFLQEAKKEAPNGPIKMAFEQLGQPLVWDKKKYHELLCQKAQELAESESAGESKPGDTLLKRTQSLKTAVLMFPSAMGRLGKGKVALMTPYRGQFAQGRFPITYVEDDEFRDETDSTEFVTPLQFMVLFEIKQRMLTIAARKNTSMSLDIRVLPHPVVDDYEWNIHFGQKKGPTRSLLETVSWKSCAEVPWSALYGNSNWENFIFIGTHLKMDGSRPWSHHGELIEKNIQGELIEEVHQAIKPGVPRLCRWKPCSLCAARMVHEVSDIVNSTNAELEHAKKRYIDSTLFDRTDTSKHEADWMKHSLDAFSKAPDIYRADGFFLRMKRIVG